MRKPVLYILVFIFLMPVLALGQKNKRPQVLVYGSGADAFAAAIQAAMSNLNTVWLSPDDKLVPELTTEISAIEGSEQLDGGIWATFLASTLNHDDRNDSIAAIAKKRINPQIAENVITALIERYPNLTIVRGAQLRSAKKVRKNWEVELANRAKYRIRAVVDASADGVLWQLALPGTAPAAKSTLAPDYLQAGSHGPINRTGVAVANLHHAPYTLPLAVLIPADDSNLFATRSLPALQTLLTGSVNDVPLLMHAGQAIGAAAAYSAFYETTSDKIDLRSVQGELVQYGGRLIPFQDIAIESPHFGAIQRVGATGLLPGTHTDEGLFVFEPDKTVSTAEIATVMDRLYSRSQIWFADNRADTMLLSDLLSLIKYVGHRGNELEGQVEKNWKRRFQFTDTYALDMPITRRHFAVLMDAYCRPFDVKVGLDGTIYR